MTIRRWIRGCGVIAIAIAVGCSDQSPSDSVAEGETAAILAGPGDKQHEPVWGGRQFDGGMMMGDGGPISEGGISMDAGAEGDPGGAMACRPNSPALMPASDLRASLTGLLVEHVALLTVMARVGVPEPEMSPSTSVVDHNTVALTDIVRDAWGPSQAAHFRTLWRLLVRRMLTYAEAARAQNTAGTQQAEQLMEAAVDQLAVWAANASPQLAGKEFKTNLQDGVMLTAAAVDAAATGNPAVFTRLQVAANQMTRTAAALAATIVSAAPNRYPGQVQGSASDLRSRLALLLVGHSYLAWLQTDPEDSLTMKEEGKKAWDVDAAGLGQLMKGLGGANRSIPFMKLWRDHSSLLEQYGVAVATNDEASAMTLREYMRANTIQIVQLLGSMTPGADQGAIFTEIERHDSALIAAIHARVESDAAQFRTLRRAGQEALDLSKWLSGELSSSFPSGKLPPVQP